MFKKKFILSSVATVVLALSSASSIAESWSMKQSKAREDFNKKRLETKVSRAGIELGERVIFRNVGAFFYIGWADGDVYVADIDEQGGHNFDEAVRACEGRGMDLPTIDQLDLFRLNSNHLDHGQMTFKALSGGWYWSKTRFDNEHLWVQRFSDGVQQPIKDKFVARLRCVKVY